MEDACAVQRARLDAELPAPRGHAEMQNGVGPDFLRESFEARLGFGVDRRQRGEFQANPGAGQPGLVAGEFP